MANNIKVLRTLNNMSQEKMSKLLNVSQGTFSNWERGEHDVDNDNLRKLAEIFNVSTDYILGITADLPQKEYLPPFSLEGIENIVPIETYKIPSIGNCMVAQKKWLNLCFMTCLLTFATKME